MSPYFARRCHQVKLPTATTSGCLVVLIFVLIIFPDAFATGAGKSNVSCQGTVISASDDIVSIINSGKKNQTFCIEGEHRITSTIHVQSGQSLIGTTPNSRISGAVVLNPWQPTSTQGVYYYDGAYAAIHPHQQNQFRKGGANVCYKVTTYQDDLFFRSNAANDQRIMRVLSETEVDPTQPVTTHGQAVTAGEAGRFFFDYANQRIYVSLPNGVDPNTVTVDLAINLNGGDSESLIFGPGHDHVTLQNLFVEKAMNYGLFGGSSWTLKDMTIRFIHNVGAYDILGSVAQPATIDDTLFTSNGRKALNATDVTITDSEMSWNNIANFRQTDAKPGSNVCNGYDDAGTFHVYDEVGTPSQPAVTINNLWSHNNIGDGLWSDGGTQYIQITNSTFNGNERYGYAHEISCQILFNGNTIYGNGYPLKNPDITGGGVDVSDSNYGTFSSNILYDNYAGYAFHLTFQTPHGHMDLNKCLGARNSNDTSSALKYNQVVSNTIYACSGDAAIGKAWGPGGTLNSRGNQYQSNNYHLADATSNWFSDGNSTNNYVPQAWSTWQQGNHDTQGTLTVGCTHRRGGKEKALVSFSGSGEPSLPYAGLTFDKAGNLYGTTQLGGAYNQGTVFELTPSSAGWTVTVLYSFPGGHDGSQPTANVILDASGRLYGTTSSGGGGSCSPGCGVVFELAPVSGGWRESVLYAFTGGGDGREPQGDLVFDAAGNLYGTTLLGGNTATNCSSGCGTVFKLTPGIGGWTQSVLHAFAGGNDGASPYAGLTFDTAGNIYGTTSAGGASGKGTIFKLSPSGGWTESVLYAFTGGPDGASPRGGLILDAAGNLYGTAFQGGTTGYGVVFELLPNSRGAWEEKELHRFANAPAANPISGLIFDTAGNLYGTTMLGADLNSCAGGCGTLFRLTPASSGGWTFHVLHAFGRGTDGYKPSGKLISDAAGNLYGTTQSGGNHGHGVVFELAP
jgi:uncharacterized repeat protein (TIGR03803 family)